MTLPSDPAVPQNADDSVVAQRAIAFPEDEKIHEERLKGLSRPKGPEMRRTLTQEDRELADAGYEHLDASKQKKTGSEDDNNIDIQEHKMSFATLENELKASFDVQDASKSRGLTEEEAKARLQRDGPNVLTPTKKRSALMKVCNSQWYCIGIQFYVVSFSLSTDY
jgi:sodium/potassium-transporting ATPase subunit alpha